jgi:hypothetical protein
MLSDRRSRHDRLSVALAGRADADLLGPVRATAVGIGGESGVVEIDGLPVFVKRIPITRRELDRPRSTANLFGLPVSAQYGIGGPTFNVWRELAANLLVTDAVLAGETPAFPILHHWRVLPGRPPIAAEHADAEATAARFGGDAAAARFGGDVAARVGGDVAVRRRLEELAEARDSLVLFFEYVGDPLLDWLDEDPAGRAATLERQLTEIAGFLRRHELLHMDGHFGNLRSDGDQIYLTDFGLATSPRFELSDAERDFADRHAGHDADYAAMRLVNWLVTRLYGVPKEQFATRNEFVRRCAEGDIPPGPAADILARHAPAAARTNDVYWKLFE